MARFRAGHTLCSWTLCSWMLCSWTRRLSSASFSSSARYPGRAEPASAPPASSGCRIVERCADRRICTWTASVVRPVIGRVFTPLKTDELRPHRRSDDEDLTAHSSGGRAISAPSAFSTSALVSRTVGTSSSAEINWSAGGYGEDLSPVALAARGLVHRTRRLQRCCGMEASGEDSSPIGVLQARSRRTGGNDRSRCPAPTVHRRATTSCGHTATICRDVAVRQHAASTRRCDRSPGHRRRTRCELATGLPGRTRAAATRRCQPHRFRRSCAPR